MNRSVVLSGAVLICLSIILGAFGAHGLKNIVDDYGIEVFEKGTKYQMYMGLALLSVGFSADKLTFNLKWFHLFAVLGVIIFSGLLYVLAFKAIVPGVSIAGAIVPIGGTLMIVAWVIFIIQLLKSKI